MITIEIRRQADTGEIAYAIVDRAANVCYSIRAGYGPEALDEALADADAEIRALARDLADRYGLALAEDRIWRARLAKVESLIRGGGAL